MPQLAAWRYPRQRLSQRAALLARVACLADPQNWPEHPARVEVRETHASFLFLTERHVYKLKKPVRLPGCDLAQPALRRRNAYREVRLNRRHAPGVYLGVRVLVRGAGGALRVAPPGRAQHAVVDWLVWMRRLPRHAMLDERLRRGTLAPPRRAALAGALAALLARGPVIAVSPADYLGRLAAELAACRLVLGAPAYGLAPAQVAGVLDALAARFEALAAVLGARAGGGWVRDGHGDLRAEHVCLLAGGPVLFDCLEFNAALRARDPVDELAYLGLECTRLGAPALAGELLGAWEACTGDRPSPRLADFYRRLRAAVHARLTIQHLHELPPARQAGCLARARALLAAAGA